MKGAADMATPVSQAHMNKYIVVVFMLLQVTRAEDSTAFNIGLKQDLVFGQAKQSRYLLYDVNPGEGFNLRRDVYMRVANLVKFLNEIEPWTLVLPPWGPLYHWKSDLVQENIPWATFFDLESLGRHVPVMEFQHFLSVTENRQVSQVYYLQKYEEGWTNGKWEEKIDKRSCLSTTGFHQDSSGLWRWHFWGQHDVRGVHFGCVSVQAQASRLVPFLTENSTASSVLLVRAEELIHGEFSEWSPLFWTARRSLVFAQHLRDIADEFRETELHSTDVLDRTELSGDWTKDNKKHGEALGGPYLAVHLRRQDFLYGHHKDVPSIKAAAEQIEKALKKIALDTVFVATDAPQSEFEELTEHLKHFTVKRYVPPQTVLESYTDGGVAIIDQWICAHARYFMGTSVSTFTFRIHEEREIIGFEPDSTFNRLCGDSEASCEQPTKWVIKYG